MSLELLVEYEVFEHRTISPADIKYLYKPYGEICSSKPENSLLKAVMRGKKIMVRGRSGAGKTCLINYVISELDTSYFPIMFPVRLSGEHDKICSDASEFVAFMLHRILSAVQEAKTISRRQYNKFRKYLSGEMSYREGKADTFLGRLTSKLSWIPGFAQTSAEVGGQIEKYTEYALSQKIFVEDKVGCINEIIRIQNDKGITPVIVLDDTDKFLQIGAIDKTGLIDEFFVYIAPLFRDFNCPIIFPTHDRYMVHDSYQYAEKNIMDKEITIPELSFNAFIKMLDHKVKSVLEDSKIEDFIERDAIRLVYSQLYKEKTEERMRNSLRTINEIVKASVRNNIQKVDFNRMAYHLLG